MKTEKIHDGWGVIWRPTKQELFSMSADEFRDNIYQHRLIIIKSVGDLNRAEIYWLMDRFGKPWNEFQYIDSQERFSIEQHADQRYVITNFSSNTSRKITSARMAWHCDIPNHETKPFPIRFLYMKQQPNPEYGQTEWLNIDLDQLNLSEEELKYYGECSVQQQSWWHPGTNLRILPMIKTHPIVDRQSLRLNYFVNSDGTRKDAWILKSFHNGQEISNHDLIGSMIQKLVMSRPELYYRHRWDTGDMAIYDNWSFVHGRTRLVLEAGEAREFIRGNIDHEPTDQFQAREHFKL
jgi:alpha-ketoglutarate-dependent taurine dioxygenase